MYAAGSTVFLNGMLTLVLSDRYSFTGAKCTQDLKQLHHRSCVPVHNLKLLHHEINYSPHQFSIIQHKPIVTRAHRVLSQSQLFT